jgi:hypothetical protein
MTTTAERRAGATTQELPRSGGPRPPEDMPAAGTAPADPDRPSSARLDTSAWIVFGRRFPRRWSLYFRIVAIFLLALFLIWWFTRDVTYVSNVKVAGLDEVQSAYRPPLRALAGDQAALVNQLADRGYAWQSGGLPMMRADGALSAKEQARAVALGTLEVKGGKGLASGTTAKELASFLQGRGWTLRPSTTPQLDGAERTVGPLHAIIEVQRNPGGSEALTMVVTAN